MNRYSAASFLIIVSIFVLALKDAASFVHALLHYIPNPWHQHDVLVQHDHVINPLEIHKYLQQKHTHSQHSHDHTHGHSHVHDVMDHIHSTSTDSNSSSEEIKTVAKIDFYFQSDPDFSLPQKETDQHLATFPMHAFSLVTRGVCPPHQPPQL